MEIAKIRWRIKDILLFIKDIIKEAGSDIRKLFRLNILLIIGIGISIYLVFEAEEIRVVMAFLIVFFYVLYKKYRTGDHRFRERQKLKEKYREQITPP